MMQSKSADNHQQCYPTASSSSIFHIRLSYFITVDLFLKMGASASKQAGKVAAAAGRRQYPSSPSILNNATSTSNAPGSTTTNAPPQAGKPFAPSQVHPDPHMSPPTDTKDTHIDLDGRDPQFGAALQRLGPAIPVERAAPQQGAFPTSSQPPLGQQGQNIFPSRSPQANSSLRIVEARKKIAERYDHEMEGLGRASFPGRSLITAKEVREAMLQRDSLGKSSQEIEKQMKLKPGILDELAKKGLYANV